MRTQYMSKYNKKIGQGKLGVNLIRSFSDENQCYFHEIKQENDVGIDAFIEFTKNGENDGKCIAVQIKNGNSFFNKLKTEAKISIGSHYNYWKNHSLDVYGIVCDYDSNVAYWVCISDYLITNQDKIESGKLKSIKFPLMEFNELNKTTFETIFKRFVYGALPAISYKQALSWTHSKFEIEKIISIKFLAQHYAYNSEIWDRFFEILKTETDSEVLFETIKYFSYIPHHPDLWGSLNFSEESKARGIELIKSIDKQLTKKMLSLIDDGGIARGTIGQCIESVIKLIPNINDILKKIIEENKNCDLGIYAFYILAHYDIKFIISNSEFYINMLGDEAKLVIECYNDNGFFDLYA